MPPKKKVKTLMCLSVNTLTADRENLPLPSQTQLSNTEVKI